MSKRSLAIFVCALGLLAAIAVGLRSGLKAAPLATLIETQGAQVDRDLSTRRELWQPALPGAEFSLGDGLRTGAAATAKLKLFDQSQLAVMPSTTLRFLNDEQHTGGLNVDIEAGEARLRAGTQDLPVRTHVGLAVIKANSEVSLQRDGDALSIAVTLGSVRFADAEGAEQNLAQGADLRVGIGMAILGVEVTPLPEATPQRVRLLLDVGSPGARRRAARQRSWEDLEVGEHEIEPGTELRLNSESTAIVSRGEDHADLRGAGQYLLGAGASLVETRSGNILIESTDQDVQVGVPGGLIMVRGAPGGSRANVSVGAEEGQIEVERGATSVTLNGQTEELGAGDKRAWSTGLVADDEAGSTGGEAPAPGYFNLSAPAGESFVLHSPQLPVSVALDFSSKCPGEAELELVNKRRRVRGTGSVNVLLPAGLHSYVLRCGAPGATRKVAARGTIRVLLDPGTRELPPLAAHLVRGGRRAHIHHLLPQPAARHQRALAQCTGREELSARARRTAAADREGGAPVQVGQPARRHAPAQLSRHDATITHHHNRS